jgi:hypothetical protein
MLTGIRRTSRNAVEGGPVDYRSYDVLRCVYNAGEDREEPAPTPVIGNPPLRRCSTIKTLSPSKTMADTVIWRIMKPPVVVRVIVLLVAFADVEQILGERIETDGPAPLIDALGVFQCRRDELAVVLRDDLGAVDLRLSGVDPAAVLQVRKVPG